MKTALKILLSVVVFVGVSAPLFSTADANSGVTKTAQVGCVMTPWGCA